MAKSISIVVDNDVYKLLKSRAKKEMFTVRELVEDIVRRSMLSYKGGKRTTFKIDDKLVGAFSRERRGRRRKKR